MILTSLIAFWGALISIVLFFVFKMLCIHKEVSCCKRHREKMDNIVLHIESEAIVLWGRVENVPTFGYFATKITHVTASIIASFAGFIEKKAHSIADWAARRDIDTQAKTKSDFLLKVGEHKNSL